MKKILFALMCAFAVLATGCQKENENKSNDLVGTKWGNWEYVDDFPVAMNQIYFDTETSATMTRTPFIGGEEEMTMTISYTYSAPNIVITSEFYSLTGIVNGNTMTFQGAGDGGEDMVFTKADE